MINASSGENPSDKDQPSRSDHNELASIDGRSFDPGHEPRKEGSMKMKHSPLVGEKLPNIDGLRDDGVQNDDKSTEQASQKLFENHLYETDQKDYVTGSCRSPATTNREEFLGED